MYEFDWSSVMPGMPFLLQGLVITAKITVTAIVIGILWGTILAMMRLAGCSLCERLPLRSAGDGAVMVLSDCA